MSDTEFQACDLRHYELGGIHFRTAKLDTLRGTIEHWISKPAQNRQIGFVNPHVFNLACEHDEVHQFLNNADVVCVDGIGVKLTMLAMTRIWVPRVVAEHLFNALLQSNTACEAILIGGEPEVAYAAQSAINKASNAVQITDVIDGYQEPDIYVEFLTRHANASLVLIGAGTPVSERLAKIANDICNHAVIFHIGGGTVNTWASKKKRGPAWVSRLGLEWLHRCIFEPHTRHRYTQGGMQYLKNVMRRDPSRSQAHHGETR